MNIRPLLIDNSIQQRVTDILSYAELNPMTLDDMLDIKNGDELPAGDRKEMVVHIPYGYKCVFSHELQPAGRCKHLSVSVSEDGKMPSLEAVGQLMLLFEFSSLENCHVWIEDFAPGRSAINVIELISDTK